MSLPSATEVSERLVGSPAFKAGGTGDPCPAGSIPVHLRHLRLRRGGPRYRSDGRASTFSFMTKNRALLIVVLLVLLAVLARKVRDV